METQASLISDAFVLSGFSDVQCGIIPGTLRYNSLPLRSSSIRFSPLIVTPLSRLSEHSLNGPQPHRLQERLRILSSRCSQAGGLSSANGNVNQATLRDGIGLPNLLD